VSLTCAISTHEGYREYLLEAVTSALRHADEVVVYSDGKTDFEWENVRVVSLPKTGYCVMARQMAIAEAQCDYIVHLDADDRLGDFPPEVGDIAFADLWLCDSSGAVREVWDYSDRPTTAEAAFDFMRSRIGTLYGRMPIPGKASFRVKWLHDNGLSWYQWPNTTFGEDVRTMIEYLLHDPTIIYTGAPYYLYSIHEGQDSTDLARRDIFMRDIDAYLQGEPCIPTSTP
jgi:hypothetical protein